MGVFGCGRKEVINYSFCLGGGKSAITISGGLPFSKTQKHMAVCGLSLHLGNTESRKDIEQKFIFQIGTLSPCGINERFSFL